MLLGFSIGGRGPGGLEGDIRIVDDRNIFETATFLQTEVPNFGLGGRYFMLGERQVKAMLV